MIRAGYSLWQFPAVLKSEAWYLLFLTGLRFDLALIGGLLLVPVILAPILGMIGVTRLISKSLLIIWLMFALGFILITEFVTPYFILEKWRAARSCHPRGYRRTHHFCYGVCIQALCSRAYRLTAYCDDFLGLRPQA